MSLRRGYMTGGSCKKAALKQLLFSSTRPSRQDRTLLVKFHLLQKGSMTAASRGGKAERSADAASSSRGRVKMLCWRRPRPPEQTAKKLEAGSSVNSDVDTAPAAASLQPDRQSDCVSPKQGQNVDFSAGELQYCTHSNQCRGPGGHRSVVSSVTLQHIYHTGAKNCNSSDGHLRLATKVSQSP